MISLFDFLVSRDGSAACFHCARPLTSKGYTRDHVIPRSKGGSSSRRNLVLCCSACNNERGAEDFLTFHQEKRRSLALPDHPLLRERIVRGAGRPLSGAARRRRKQRNATELHNTTPEPNEGEDRERFAPRR